MDKLDKLHESSSETKSKHEEHLQSLLGNLRERSRDVSEELVCKEVEGDEGGFLKMICGADFDDFIGKLRGVESLRSAPEFGILANKLIEKWPDDHRKFKMLYPGSGPHIAPIVLPVALIDAGKIDEADLVLTEIAWETNRLGKNLVTLIGLDKNFEMPSPPEFIDRSRAGEGVGPKEVVWTILYKGKPIKVRFMYMCNGGNWFGDEDFKDLDVYLSHDSPGADVSNPLVLMTEYFEQRKSLGISDQLSPGVASGVSMLSRYFVASDSPKLPFVVMEDLTNTMDSYIDQRPSDFEYWRQFDLELIGKFERGEKGYGHRDKFSKRGIDSEGAHSDSVEIGRPDSRNGVLLEVYPRLFELSNDELQVLMEISLIANNPDNFKSDTFQGRERLTTNLEGMKMLSANPYVRGDILKYGNHILEVVSCIDPVLSRGLALRIFQIFINERVDVYGWAGAVRDVKEEYVEYIKFLSGIRGYLNPEDVKLFGKNLDLLNKYYQKNKDEYKSRDDLSKAQYKRYRGRVLFYEKEKLNHGALEIDKYADDLFGGVSTGW